MSDLTLKEQEVAPNRYQKGAEPYFCKVTCESKYGDKKKKKRLAYFRTPNVILMVQFQDFRTSVPL